MEMNIICILRYFLEYEVQIVTVIKPFHATDLFLYPLKTSENVFREYQKRSVAWNGLKFKKIPKVGLIPNKVESIWQTAIFFFKLTWKTGIFQKAFTES